MLIKVENLSAYYQNKKVFDNISFSVHKDDYLCIVGENGSGKTTLMRALLGLDIKYTGSIELCGFSKKQIGWLPQSLNSAVDFPSSVAEVVLSGFGGKSFWGFGFSKEQRKQAQENMRLLGIEELSKKPFSNLSGGQKQKALLCRALCASEGVLLLDEPTAGLDPESQAELYSAIASLNKNGTAIIMITHDTKRALQEAKHILSLGNSGWFYGTADEYLDFGGAV